MAAIVLRHVLTAFVVVAGLAANAQAQRLLYSYGGFDGSTAVTALLDLSTGRTTPIGAGVTTHGVFTADGQYLVRVVTVGTTAETRIRHVPSGVETRLSIAFVPRVAHPRALAVFGTIDGVMSRLDPSGTRSWTPCGPGITAGFQLSGDGARLFTVCPDGRFLVVDAESGAIVRDTTIGAVSSFVVSPDGSDVVVGRATSAGPELARLDAVTGQAVVARPALRHPLAVAPGPLSPVPGGARLIESELVLGTPGNTGYEQRLVDFLTLNVAAPLPVPRTPFPQRLVIAEDGREAYASVQLNAGGGVFSTVSRFDLESGALLASATGSPLSVAAVASLPRPVEALDVQVTGRTVALSWQLPSPSAAATGYRLAIGTRTAAVDLGSIRLGPGETFTATGVPPGRYFVRLHGVNATGEGPPSAELVIDVP